MSEVETNVYKINLIHQLIEYQTKQTPDAVAVIFQNQQLTYRELNEKANQLAHYLKTLGAGVEVLVGVCVERSLEMLITLLGVLKAGAAYVPLDPAYPPERLAFMLEDSGLPILISQQSLIKILPKHSAKIISIDRDWPIISQHSKENLDSGVSEENLAYTIYTSGSTGKPKGVQVLHRGVVNFLESMKFEPGINRDDILLAVTTISFDIAVLELFLPLTVGACVVIVSREVASDGGQLSKTIAMSGATIIQATPATWRMLLAVNWQGNPKLKILCGGEAMTRSLADQLLERCASLWNMYGPTETTIWSTIYPVQPDGEKVSIGYPIANTQIYLREQFSRRQNDPFKLAAPGEMGELYIGGDGLARGYFNRPEMTDDRFISDPFSNKPNARLYKTGDLARYLPNGNLEFIGRVDHQVKLRGYRIELGDIEAAISQHPNVKEAVTIVRHDGLNQERLVAYLAPKYHPLDTQKTLVGNDKNQSQIAAQWQVLWNTAYKGSQNKSEPTFNTSGWINSYTGQPIPEIELKEWVDCTVNRILALKPDRVLEIGCGLGLLLFRIAPHCSRYFGLDMSPEAIKYIQGQLKQQPGDFSQVTVAQQAADQLLHIEQGEFDTVVINSVIQYFPNLDYLVNVIKTVVKAIKPGGKIFIGDVRNLSLLENFHTSVQLYQASSSLSTAQLRQRIWEQVAQDRELVIQPEFFAALQQHLPEINRVEIQLKDGAYHNEMTKFRYDVVLHVGIDQRATAEPIYLNWQREELNFSKIRHFLTETKPEFLVVTQIPNFRLLQEIKVKDILSSDDCPETVGELQLSLQSLTAHNALEPQALWNLSEDLPYEIQIDWSVSGKQDCYDVIFQRQQGKIIKNNWAGLREFHIPEGLKPLKHYANNPLHAHAIRNLVPQLRNFLKEKLPDYMIPAAFVVMEALPLTPNGKLDRRSLPEPSQIRPTLESTFVAPQSPIEKQLAQIWSEVLEIEQIGIQDNFFELGGHSLLVTQLIHQIKEIFDLELSLLVFFKIPTISKLAQAIAVAQKKRRKSLEIDLTYIDLEAEAILPDDIGVNSSILGPVAEPHNIFLTGATGFLGAFLLDELLKQTQATIYCLTRASSTKIAQQKIQKNLERYGLIKTKINQRVIPVLGDLSKIHLGLAKEQFDELADKIDLIYHNGALVNLIYPYTALRAANVLGTQEILRLASQIKLKPVHFISTLDIFQSPDYLAQETILETGTLTYGNQLENGYAQSKWVAEKLVMASWERGIPGSIYRLGMIVGHSQTGISKTDDLVGRLIKGFIQMGSLPDLDLKMNLTPVDYATKAMIHLSKQQQSWHQAFHLVNHHTLTLKQLFDYIRAFGYSIEQLDYNLWQQQLHSLDISENNALTPLDFLFTERIDETEPTYLETLVLGKFDCQNARAGLVGTNITCPPMDTELMKNYFSYFMKSGFLEVPQNSLDNKKQPDSVPMS